MPSVFVRCGSAVATLTRKSQKRAVASSYEDDSAIICLRRASSSPVVVDAVFPSAMVSCMNRDVRAHLKPFRCSGRWVRDGEG